MASDNGREIAQRRRKQRLETALRANLKQRKTQQRARLANVGAAAVKAQDCETREADSASADQE